MTHHLDSLTEARPVRPLGYVSSGRFAADYARQEVQTHIRRFAMSRREGDEFWQRWHWHMIIKSAREARLAESRIRDFDL